MKTLAEREITSVLVEGGGNLHFSMLQAGLVDKIFAFVTPKIFGGKNAPSAVSGDGFKTFGDAVRLKNFSAEKNNHCIQYYMNDIDITDDLPNINIEPITPVFFNRDSKQDNYEQNDTINNISKDNMQNNLKSPD